MKLETATKFCISTWLSHLTTLYIIIIFFDRAIDDLNYFVQPCFEITSLRQTGQEQLFWKTNTQNELENWSDQITKIQHARTQHARSQHARSRHTRPQYTRWPIIMCVSISRVSLRRKLCSFDPSKFWFRIEEERRSRFLNILSRSRETQVLECCFSLKFGVF